MFGVENFKEAIVQLNENFDISQLGTAALYGGAMLLIGMLTIFAVLCILWVSLVLFKLFFHDLPARRAREKSEASSDSVATPVVEYTPAADAEIVAVIAAAIAAAEAEGSGLKFRVVSFRRK